MDAMLRVFIVVIVLGGVTHANPPSGYKCGAGKANPGVGCTCPAGMVDKRNQENHAICAKAAPTVSPCRKAAIVLRGLFQRSSDFERKIAVDKRAAFLAKFGELIEKRCVVDKWKSEATTCFVQASGEEAVETCAEAHLTKEQLQGLEKDFDALEKQHRKGDAPSGEKPATADTGRVVVKDSRIEIREQVFFESAKSSIKPMSFALLNSVAQALKEHPEIQLVNIEGHTDSEGDDETNLKLSKDRANAVLAYLVRQGIGEGRLFAVGYGETRPLASNRTPKGRAQNRRIEFLIMKTAQ